MIHIDFASGIKMSVAAPTQEDADRLFDFLRTETDVHWAGGDPPEKTLWHYFAEQTSYRFGSHHGGLQVGSIDYALKNNFLVYDVDGFIEEFGGRSVPDDIPDMEDLL